MCIVVDFYPEAETILLNVCPPQSHVRRDGERDALLAPDGSLFITYNVSMLISFVVGEKNKTGPPRRGVVVNKKGSRSLLLDLDWCRV